MPQFSEKDKVFRLKPFQSRFVLSEKRYPAYVGAWATGKSLTGIARAMKLSTDYPNNLGFICRKEFTDLKDSTVKDFENYTGLKVNSNREVTLPNKSVIMFRHLEELNNIQNINLGWFWIEQAEELESDAIFFTLFGRLRRHGVKHSGFITANVAGHNWIYDLWKCGKLQDADLIEAKTFDNKDVLPSEFLSSLEQIKNQRPEIYGRFVMNDWDIDGSQFTVLPASYVRDCVDNHSAVVAVPSIKRITVADVAGAGDDETVIYDMVNTSIVGQEIYSHRSLMDTVGRIQMHAQKNGSTLVCVDKVGEGAGVYDRLREVYQGAAVQVYGFDGRTKAPDGLSDETYFNYKTYAWFKAREMFFERRCNIPNDEILIKQLTSVTYSMKSEKKFALDPKEDLKEKLKCSPDRADAYIMGLDALQHAKPVEKSRVGGEYAQMWKGGSYVPTRATNDKRLVMR